MNAMANGRHEDSNNEQGSGNQEHNEKIGLGVHLNNYIDHSSIQGDVVGNAANEGVGSTTSFAGVAVAAEGWLAIICEICNQIDAYRLSG
jgi:hypothetical protein